MASIQTITVTIASGGTASTHIPENTLRNARALEVIAPALTGSVVLQSGDDDTDSANFVTVQSPPGTDVAITAQKSTVITSVPFKRARLLSNAGGGEAADRSFVIHVKVGE